MSIIFCLIAGNYALKIYRTFGSLTSTRLIFVTVFLTFWTTTVFATNLAAEFQLVSDDILRQLVKFSISLLFVSFAIIAYIQINPIYGRDVRLFGAISFSCFVILIGFTLSEVIGSHNFLDFQFRQGLWITKPDPLYTLVITSAIISFTLSYYFSSEFLKDFPESLLENQIILFTKKRITLIIFAVLGLYISYTVLPIEFAAVIAVILELVVSLLLLIYMYLSSKQPFLQIGYGANPYLMLDNNFIGYFVGSSLDSGPNIIVKSDNYFERSSIPEISLEALNVGIITLLGINDSFKEQVAIVPVPKYDQYTSIAISFFLENPNVSDKRVKYEAPSVLAIIIPSVMVLSLKGFNTLKTQLKELIKDFNHIDKMDDKNIRDLVATILHQLLY